MHHRAQGFSLLLLLSASTTLLSFCAAQAEYEENFNYNANAADEFMQPHTTYRPQPIYPAPAPQDPSVIVVPRLGLVRGNMAYKTIKSQAVNAFLGLKYGHVGSGIARFQKANPPQYHSQDDVIDATREPANCPQFPDLREITEAAARGKNVDDCLTLNIYAPNKAGYFPVMVFVHGEMLFDGSAAEGQPDYFLEHDVVLITLNYRLAPFGFLSTLTNEMPGNVALADIQMALEWIQQYIRPFGGNPEQLTLFGQAGGATLVHALSLSGKADGLFQKLILQSGTALNPYFLDEDPISTVRSFARFARCPIGGVRDAVQELNNCFARLSTVELLNVFKRHWEENERHGLRSTGGFKLVVGDKLGYLNQHPAALVANHTCPLIAGVTKDAGAFLMSRFYDQLAQLQGQNISEYIRVVLKHTAQPRHYMVWRNWALQHIFDEEAVRNPTLNNLAQGLLELINLILYRAPVIDALRFTSKKNPTYLYCFDYRGQFHRFGHLSNPLPFEPDATLSDDNIYLFPYPEEVSQLNAQDMSIARALTTMWVNFAHTNIPNFNAGIWPNVSTEYGPFLRFTNSRNGALELDYHFGEGIPVPNLYPEYFAATTTPKPTTTQRPYFNSYARPSYANYPQYQPRPTATPQQQHQKPAWRAHETVLNEPFDDDNIRSAPYQRYPNYAEQGNQNINTYRHPSRN